MHAMTTPRSTSAKRRKRFSEREVIETLWHQGVILWCYRCRGPIHPQEITDESGVVRRIFDVQREHIHEVALDGPDIPANCRYSHTDCHKIATDGTRATTAGSSKHRIAKTKPHRTEKFVVEKRPMSDALAAVIAADAPRSRWPKRKIPSRKFKKKEKTPS